MTETYFRVTKNRLSGKYAVEKVTEKNGFQVFILVSPNLTKTCAELECTKRNEELENADAKRTGENVAKSDLA